MAVDLKKYAKSILRDIKDLTGLNVKARKEAILEAHLLTLLHLGREQGREGSIQDLADIFERLDKLEERVTEVENPVYKWGPGTCGECGRKPCSEACPTQYKEGCTCSIAVEDCPVHPAKEEPNIVESLSKALDTIREGLNKLK